MTPQRIQRRRTAGWRMPEGAVYVGRPTKWGNPYLVERCRAGVPGWRVIGNGRALWSADDGVPWTRQQAIGIAVEEFRSSIPPRSIRARQIEIELRGKDLACWCPLEDDAGAPVPCHADVLLEIANRSAS